MSNPEQSHDPERPSRVQLHLVLPYKFQLREHHEIRGYLDRGYRVVQLQRITDREVIVTLADGSPSSEAPPG